MESHSFSCNTLHLLVAVLAALNVALNTWLVNRRSQADKREEKRNGNGHTQRGTVAESLYPSESARSTPRSAPKD